MPEYPPHFPGQKLTTEMEWGELVLDHSVLEQLMEILNWLTYGSSLLKDWGLSKRIKPGFRVLFYGPPGTGKTLAAALLGKTSNKEVYQVDLSTLVSNYIGETEKNLEHIFASAEQEDCILLFDEADALFGKRTTVHESRDREMNQQTAYLLQRIENYTGVVILATNHRANIDEAFVRRFQQLVHFPMPDCDERYRLWQNAFSGTCTLSPDIDLHRIAQDYELSGGAIVNVLQFCALAAISREDTVVTMQELMTGIRNEYKKTNRTID